MNTRENTKNTKTALFEYHKFKVCLSDILNKVCLSVVLNKIIQNVSGGYIFILEKLELKVLLQKI